MNQEAQVSADYLREVMQNSKAHQCIHCNGVFFKQVVTIRVVSSLLSGTGREVLAPIPMFRCDDCGAPVEQLPEIKSKKEEEKKSTSKLITE